MLGQYMDPCVYVCHTKSCHSTNCHLHAVLNVTVFVSVVVAAVACRSKCFPIVTNKQHSQTNYMTIKAFGFLVTTLSNTIPFL